MRAGPCVEDAAVVVQRANSIALMVGLHEEPGGAQRLFAIEQRAVVHHVAGSLFAAPFLIEGAVEVVAEAHLPALRASAKIATSLIV